METGVKLWAKFIENNNTHFIKFLQWTRHYANLFICNADFNPYNIFVAWELLVLFYQQRNLRLREVEKCNQHPTEIQTVLCLTPKPVLPATTHSAASHGLME